MEQHDREELAEVNAARKGFYEFLASMYKLELTDEQIGTCLLYTSLPRRFG